MSDEKMDKDTLLQMINAARFRFDMLLTVFTNEQMTQPGVEGDWSIKDIIAHVTWSERETVYMLREHSIAEGVGSDLWNLPQDERNRAVYEENRDRSLADVLEESRQVFADLIEVLEEQTEEDLTDSVRYKDMPGEWLPWRVIAGNTYLHYHDHAEAIGIWFDKINSET